MKIAIFGASSLISKDLIINFIKHNPDFKLHLFSRNKSILKEWLNSNNILKNIETINEYEAFVLNKKFDVVMNFVGIGDPTKLKKIGEDIISITNHYDDLVIKYLKKNIKTKYIFMSSGIVEHKEDNKSKRLANHYLTAKLNAEKKHRSMKDLSIVDLRIFNYISKTIDLNSSFLITDIFNAVINKKVFKTNSLNIYRDFVGSDDFYRLILCAIEYSLPINMSIDCYSRSHTDKISILEMLSSNFNLKYELNDNLHFESPSGEKLKYYSTKMNGGIIGFEPSYSSLDTISLELKRIIL